MIRTTALLIALFASVPALADDALKHNPFSRPPSTIPEGSVVTAGDDGEMSVIDLRATMVASNRGLANVGGRIIRPGETIDELTLYKVYEDRAVFLREGKRLVVFVKPDLVKDDAD